ncbi:MAG: LytTR family transcriptional regulator [Chitinophagaceae bacterium]|nr:LytTR family transcriptional regulator [Chitinophagaceae bacterium]
MKYMAERRVRIALCVNKDLDTEIQRLFKHHPAFEIIFSVGTEKQLLQQLAVTPHYYHVLLFLDSTIALRNNAQLADKLVQQYPGLKTVTLLHPKTTLNDLQLLLINGCTVFMRYRWLRKFSNKLGRIDWERYKGFTDRKYLSDWLSDIGSIARINSHESRLLRLLARNKETEEIMLLLEMGSEELQDEVEYLAHCLARLGLVEERIRLQPLAEEKTFHAFKDGHRKVIIALVDIIMISADIEYVYVHLLDKSTRGPYLATLSALETELGPWGFIRVNKSHIIHYKLVDHFEKDEIHIKGHKVTLSEIYRPAFLQKMLALKQGN